MIKNIKKVFVFLCIFALIIASIPVMTTDVYAAEAPGARSATSASGDVFLGGKYIEVGVSKSGSFGTSLTAPAGFHADSVVGNRLGLIVDDDGFDVGNAPTTGDFFLPGSPYEGFNVGYNVGDSVSHTINHNAERCSVNWTSPIQALITTDESDIGAGLLKAVTTGITRDNIKYTQIVSFHVNDTFYKTEIIIENLSSTTITQTRYMRAVDPDQDLSLHSTFNTYNKVISNPRTGNGESQMAMVVSKGVSSLGSLFLLSTDNRARASIDYLASSLYDTNAWVENDASIPFYPTESDYQLTSSMVSSSTLNGYTNDDTYIGLTFSLGTLGVGESTSFNYYTSLDPNVTSALDGVKEDVASSSPATIAFDANGGSGLMNSITNTVGASITLSSNTITRNGYFFGGWSTTPNGSAVYANNATLTVPSGGLTLYAVWVPVTTNFTMSQSSGLNTQVSNLESSVDISADTAAGNNVIINLNIQQSPLETVSETERNLINNLSPGIFTSDTKKILFLDIDLLKIVGGSTTNITSTLKPITITIAVPEGLQGLSNYKIVRVHNGVAEFLDTTYDPVAKTLTFSTSLFSSYAIVASNATITPAKTGDSSNAIVLLAASALSTAIIIISGKRKRWNKKVNC